MVPFSGAMLLLVSFAWVLPELAENLGWLSGLALMLAGFAILWLIDKNLYPVCPSCSHTHDHDSCVTRLHGFAGPLVAATAVHSMFDGWALAAAYTAGQQGIWAGVVIHKIPGVHCVRDHPAGRNESRRNAFIARSVCADGDAARRGCRKRRRSAHCPVLDAGAACCRRRHVPVSRIPCHSCRMEAPDECAPARVITSYFGLHLRTLTVEVGHPSGTPCPAKESDFR